MEQDLAFWLRVVGGFVLILVFLYLLSTMRFRKEKSVQESNTTPSAPVIPLPHEGPVSKDLAVLEGGAERDDRPALPEEEGLDELEKDVRPFPGYGSADAPATSEMSEAELDAAIAADAENPPPVPDIVEDDPILDEVEETIGKVNEVLDKIDEEAAAATVLSDDPADASASQPEEAPAEENELMETDEKSRV